VLPKNALSSLWPADDRKRKKSALSSSAERKNHFSSCHHQNMALQPSRVPLSLLSFGCSSTIARAFQDRMRNQGVDATCVTISNTPASDVEIARMITSQNWSCWMAGLGLMQDRAWFERVMQIVKSTNPHVPMLDIRGPGDAENAILRQFGVRLPLATA
jgi:hypothetical protein